MGMSAWPRWSLSWLLAAAFSSTTIAGTDGASGAGMSASGAGMSALGAGMMRSNFYGVNPYADACAVSLQQSQILERQFCSQHDPMTNNSINCLPRLFELGCSKCGSSSLAVHLGAMPSIHLLCPPDKVRPDGMCTDFKGGTDTFKDKDRAAEVLFRLHHELHHERRALFQEIHVYDKTTSHYAVEEFAKREKQLAKAQLPLVRGTAVTTSLHHTPNYLNVPEAPGRINQTFAMLGAALPSALRFLVILREPSRRAISSFWDKVGEHNAHWSANKTVEEGMHVMEMEMAALHMVEVCLRKTPGSLSLQWRSQSSESRCRAQYYRGFPFPHIEKGLYAPQLARWFQVFGRCAIFVTTMERMYMRGTNTSIANLKGPSSNSWGAHRMELLGVHALEINATPHLRDHPQPFAHSGRRAR